MSNPYLDEPPVAARNPYLDDAPTGAAANPYLDDTAPGTLTGADMARISGEFQNRELLQSGARAMTAGDKNLLTAVVDTFTPNQPTPADIKQAEFAKRAGAEPIPLGTRVLSGLHTGISQGIATPGKMAHSLADIALTGAGAGQTRLGRWNADMLRQYAAYEQGMAQQDAATFGNDIPQQLASGTGRAVTELPMYLAAGAGAAGPAQAVARTSAAAGVIGGTTQYAQDRGAGMEAIDALPYATASGLITALTTRAFGATGAESVFRQEGVKGLRNRVLQVLKDAGLEGAEEGADTFQQDFLERWTRNPDKPVDATIKEVLMSLAIGGIVGGSVSGVGNAIGGAQDMAADQARVEAGSREAFAEASNQKPVISPEDQGAKLDLGYINAQLEQEFDARASQRSEAGGQRSEGVNPYLDESGDVFDQVASEAQPQSLQTEPAQTSRPAAAGAPPVAPDASASLDQQARVRAELEQLPGDAAAEGRGGEVISNQSGEVAAESDLSRVQRAESDNVPATKADLKALADFIEKGGPNPFAEVSQQPASQNLARPEVATLPQKGTEGAKPLTGLPVGETTGAAAAVTSTVRSADPNQVSNERQRGRVLGNPGMTAEQGSNPSLAAATLQGAGTVETPQTAPIGATVTGGGITYKKHDSGRWYRTDLSGNRTGKPAGPTQTQQIEAAYAKEQARRAKPKKFRFSNRGYDIIDAAEENIGKISWKLIKEANPDWKPTGAARKIFAAQGEPADTAAQELARLGIYKGDPGQPDQFGAAMNNAATARIGERGRASKEKGIIAQEIAQNQNFHKDIKQANKRTEPIVATDLNEGDEFTLKGAKLRVTALGFDGDGNVVSVTLDDGKQYGTQVVDGETVLRMDKGSLERGGAAQFAAGDDFFGAPESVEEQRGRLSREKAQKAQTDQRKTMEERAGTRLTGADIDTTQEMFGGAEGRTTRQDKAGQGSLFKAESGKQKAESGLPIRQVQNVVAGLQREMPKALPTTVVHTPEELPAAVRAAAQKQGVRLAGVKGTVLGQRVYLVASNLADPAEAQSIWLHEQVGHWATDTELGGQLRSFMAQVHDSFADSSLMREVRARYPQADQITLGREVVARLAEVGNPHPGALKRLLALFRAWLRRLGLVRAVSENDLRVMLQRAAASLRETSNIQRPTSNAQSGVLEAGNATLVAPWARGEFALTAHHGTPHKVDKFTTAKIGTGEGAQVYGWGLYFAENEAVADDYRKRLAPVRQPNSLTDKMQALQVDGQPMLKQFDIESRPEFVDAVDASDFNEAARIGRDALARWQELQDDPTYPHRKYAQDKVDAWTRLMPFIARKAVAYAKPSRGNKYTVELNVEPEELLDWDKPLSEQSEKVRKAYMQVVPVQERHPGTLEGREMYDRMMNGMRGPDFDYLKGAVAKRTQAMVDAGIKGIRFLDQGSRTVDSLPRVVNMEGMGYVHAVYNSKTQKDEYFDTAKKAMAFVEELRKQQTYNYVIFNDADITITHENGQEVTAAQAVAGQMAEDGGQRSAVPEFAAGAFPARFAMRTPIKGPTGASIVGYEWRSTMGEKYSAREGGLVEARVSDWDNADESTGTGRAIVHVFYVQHPGGTVQPEGIRSAQNVLGINEARLMTIAKKERAAQQYQQDQERAEMANYAKAAVPTAQEAAREYRKLNYSPMRTFEANNEIFNESALFEKDGRFIRRNWKATERMQAGGWTLVQNDPAKTSGTTKATEAVRATQPEKQSDRGLPQEITDAVKEWRGAEKRYRRARRQEPGDVDDAREAREEAEIHFRMLAEKHSITQEQFDDFVADAKATDTEQMADLEDEDAQFAAGPAENSEFARLQGEIAAAKTELMTAIRQHMSPPPGMTKAQALAAKDTAAQRLHQLFAQQLKQMTDPRQLDIARSPEETAQLISETVDLLNTIGDDISQRASRGQEIPPDVARLRTDLQERLKMLKGWSEDQLDSEVRGQRSEVKRRDDRFLEVESASDPDQNTLPQFLTKLQFALKNVVSPIPELPLTGPRATTSALFRRGYRLFAVENNRVKKEAAEKVNRVVEPLVKLGRKPSDNEALQQYYKLHNALKRAEMDEARKKAIKAEMRKLEETHLNKDPFNLFRRLVLYKDLAWRATYLKNDAGKPITLPLGLTVEDVQAELGRTYKAIEQHPDGLAITEALRRHYTLTDELQKSILDHGEIIPESLRNPLFYPHHVLDHWTGRLDRVRPKTEEDFRRYLIAPKGSPKLIQADYLKAMYLHTADVMAHNARVDLVQKYWQPYDISEQLKAQHGEDWTMPWNTPPGYKLFAPYKKLALRADYILSREVLADKLGVLFNDGDLRSRMGEAGKVLKVTPEDLHQALVAGEKIQWALPEEIADALDGIETREKRAANPSMWDILATPVRYLHRRWKQVKLFAPWSWARYEYGNLTTDVIDKVAIADPGTAKQMGRARKEIWNADKGEQSPEFKAALREGILETITEGEMANLARLPEFEAFQTPAERRASKARSIGQVTMRGSRFREQVFRYAKFLADVERLRNGEQPVFGGAYHGDITALGQDVDGQRRMLDGEELIYAQAAEISLKTYGDYESLSVFSQFLRTYIAPFWSWQDVNFRYHANLLRNVADALAARTMPKSEAARLIGGATVSALSKAAIRVGVLLFLYSTAQEMWNRIGGPMLGLWDDDDDLEDKLSEADRRKSHVILGQDKNGKVLVAYMPGAFADVAEWVGGTNLKRLFMEYATGQISLDVMIRDYSKSLFSDFLNKAAQGTSPVLKGAYEWGSGKATFPDILNQRRIPDEDKWWRLAGTLTDDRVVNTLRGVFDKDYYSTPAKEQLQQIILQIRRRDPEQWNYWEIREKASDWEFQKTGKRYSAGDYAAPEAMALRNFRKAIYRGDVDAALHFYERLLGFGYTAERLDDSIRNQAPLSGLNKAQRVEFVASLNEREREQLALAEKYYARFSAMDRREKQLFPSKRQPNQPANPALLRQIVEQQKQ